VHKRLEYAIRRSLEIVESKPRYQPKNNDGGATKILYYGAVC
jgi:hypothetical protein